MNRCRPWLTILLLLLLCGAAKATKLYKWVDDSGRVHYSDTIPPDEAKKRREREVKSDNGQTIEKIEPPPTRQELDAEQRARREAEEKKRVREEEQHRVAEHDRMLLMTYQSVHDMEQARDDRIQAIDSQIGLIQGRIDKLQQQLDTRRREAVRLERSGKGNPDSVYREIDSLRQRIQDNRNFIARQRREQDTIRSRFSSDIARFRELMAERTAKAQRENPGH